MPDQALFVVRPFNNYNDTQHVSAALLLPSTYVVISCTIILTHDFNENIFCSVLAFTLSPAFSLASATPSSHILPGTQPPQSARHSPLFFSNSLSQTQRSSGIPPHRWTENRRWSLPLATNLIPQWTCLKNYKRLTCWALQCKCDLRYRCQPTV